MDAKAEGIGSENSRTPESGGNTFRIYSIVFHDGFSITTGDLVVVLLLRAIGGVYVHSYSSMYLV